MNAALGQSSCVNENVSDFQVLKAQKGRE